MYSIRVNFGTVRPVPFRESGCDREFLMRAGGYALVSEFDAEKFGGDAYNGIKELATRLIPDCVAGMTEEKPLMCPGNDSVLASRLEDALSKEGVRARVAIKLFAIDQSKSDEYAELFGEKIAEIAKETAAQAAHFPVVSLCYSRSSHGMMAGTCSHSSDTIEWNGDGTVTLTSAYGSSASNSRSVYSVTPEAAEKAREFAEKNGIAELSTQGIPTALCYDNFTSATISVTRDESARGGDRFETYTLNCGPSGMTFGRIEKELSDIIAECIRTGEYVTGSMSNPAGNFGGPGLFGMFSYDKPAAPEPPEPAEGEAEPGCWKCSKCGYTKNTGKFCAECGNSR
ncbi:MAG: hypothetical protein J5879_04585 [Clostridia bacterium]|nr:hypothetical protein [Clostridia bacterium]